MKHRKQKLLGVVGFLAGTLALGAPTNELPHVTSWIGNTWGAAGAGGRKRSEDRSQSAEGGSGA
jgi:hypothetical protein